MSDTAFARARYFHLPAKSLAIEPRASALSPRVSTSTSSWLVSEAVLLRGRYAVMKEAARARRR